MIQRIGYFLLIALILIGCSGDSSENQTDEYLSSGSSTEVLDDTKATEFSLVSGLLFKVEDFKVWEEEYKKYAFNTIIYLRSIDDPNMIVLFEGNDSHKEAVNRRNGVLDKAFTYKSGVENKPVTTYYNIRYYEPKDGENLHFLALSFNVEDKNNWMIMSEDRIEQLMNYGLTPLGMGSNFYKPENIYILLAVENLEQFRDNNNSPREINNFLSTLNFPKNTGLSFWFRPEN
jgi:hypothetical protein